MSTEPREYEGQKVTIYFTSDFIGNIVKTEARLHEAGNRRYAQYEDAPYLKFTRKRKRKKSGWVGTSHPYALVVEGWDAPEPDSALGEAREGSPGVLVSRSRYSSFDPHWVTDFDALIGPAIKAGTVKVVEDFRYTRKLVESFVEAAEANGDEVTTRDDVPTCGLALTYDYDVAALAVSHDPDVGTWTALRASDLKVVQYTAEEVV